MREEERGGREHVRLARGVAPDERRGQTANHLLKLGQPGPEVRVAALPERRAGLALDRLETRLLMKPHREAFARLLFGWRDVSEDHAKRDCVGVFFNLLNGDRPFALAELLELLVLLARARDDVLRLAHPLPIVQTARRAHHRGRFGLVVRVDEPVGLIAGVDEKHLKLDA